MDSMRKDEERTINHHGSVEIIAKHRTDGTEIEPPLVSAYFYIFSQN